MFQKKLSGKEAPPTFASQRAPYVPHSAPWQAMVYYLFKAAIVLCFGLVTLLWFKTVEPAVCKLM